ncbi:MAG TPA: hypothetical protein VFD49_11530 [Candidatus Dormibacteraeota bacterium]|jgi:hypothetical protein|nr:hypothetical protein [Candidatus Dormibacteraeota bacterium]
MSGTYEVLSPWAEVDPVPLAGISPRLSDLRGKRIGLCHNDKVAAPAVLDAVEAELGRRFEGLTFRRFGRRVSDEIAATPDRERYQRWVEEVDAVVLAVGD